MTTYRSASHDYASTTPMGASALGLFITVLLALLMVAGAPKPASAEKPNQMAFQQEGHGHGGPKAYRLMCARDPGLCRWDIAASELDGAGPAAAMTAELWKLVQNVNIEVNERLAPREDIEVYGTSDFWTAGRFVGDCEDYMIAKKQELIAAGLSADQLLYAVVEGIETPYHAVLILRTEQGDYVLDNLTNQITRWDVTGYRFVIRQSSESPNRWVRVIDDGPNRKITRLATR